MFGSRFAAVATTVGSAVGLAISGVSLMRQGFTEGVPS